MKRAVAWVTGVVFVGQMLFAMANNAQGVLLTSFINAFSLSGGVQGLPNAAANAGILLAMLLAVSIASRVGKYALYAGGLGLMAAMLMAAALAKGAWWLTLTYLAMGLGFGAVDTASSSIVADLHRGPRASLMMGLLHAVYGTGGILAPLWMTALLSAGAPWRSVLLALAAAVGIVFLVASYVFRRGRAGLPAADGPPERITRAGLKAFASQPGNFLFVMCAGLYCAHQCSIYLWISRIIGVGYGREALGAAALSLFWVGTVLSRALTPLTGISTVRYLRYGMLITAGLLALGLCLGGPGALCAAAALSGLVGGAALPMVLSEMDRRNKGCSMLALTAVLLTTAASAIVCAPLIGFIVERTFLAAGVIVSAVFAFLSALCAWRLKGV